MLAIDDPSATYKLLQKEFAARGYHNEEFWLANRHFIRVTSPEGKSWLTIAEHISYPLNSALIDQIADSKHVAYQFAEQTGLPIPHTVVVDSRQPYDEGTLRNLIDSYGKVIVKPENASLSHGLTLNITSYEEVVAAIEKAKEFLGASPFVLVQQQVTGQEVRFILLEGKLEAALLRETARVIGDGTSSVEELISRENQARESLVFEMISYPQLNDEIITIDVDRSRVPAEGEIVELAHSTMIRGGASIYNILDRIHESYREHVESFTRAIGAGFIVVDLFLTDYTQPLSEENTHFIEANKSPVLKLCYGCRDGKMFDIVPLLVDRIDERLKR